MANMSYCKFENTVADMQDCIDDLMEKGIEGTLKDSNQYERPNIIEFIEMCIKIRDEFYADEELEMYQNRDFDSLDYEEDY